MMSRANAGSGLWGLLGGLLLVGGCLAPSDPYFDGTSPAPVIERLVPLAEEENPDASAAQAGLVPGQPLVLLGRHLDDESLSVRLGGQPAAVLQIDADGVSGQARVVLEAPAGPVSGGAVTLTVASRAGIAERTDAYEYQVPEPGLFATELASAMLVGDPAGQVEGVLKIWDEVHPRGVTALRDAGALYFHGTLEPSGDPESLAVRWPSPARLPGFDPASVAAFETFQLTPLSGAGLEPFSLVRDPITRRFELCGLERQAASPWVADALYRVDVGGGALTAPLSLQVRVPPALSTAGKPLTGLPVGEDGVGEVNLEQALRVQVAPGVEGEPGVDAQFVMAELLVRVPSLQAQGEAFVIERLVTQAADTITEEKLGPLFSFPQALLDGLPEVSTSCLLLSSELARLEAGLLPDGSLEEVQGRYLEAGCTATEDPGTVYRLEAQLRITRHYLYALPLPAGLAGCSVPGTCAGEGDLILDLVSRFALPVNLVRNLEDADADDEGG